MKEKGGRSEEIFFMIEQQNQRPIDEGEVNLLEYWRMIWKWKILIGIIFLSLTISVLLFCIFSPKIYESTASILTPAETPNSFGNFMSSLGSIANFAQAAGISVPSVTQDRDIYIRILNSRMVQEAIVNQFNLKDHYKKFYFKKLNFTQDAIKYLQKVTTISTENEGAILITVEDKDPQLAARIANAYVNHLDRIVSQLGTGAAGRQRRFIAEQLAKTEKNLKDTEDALKQFQEQHRAVAIEEQAKGAIEAAAILKGEIMATEVELQLMQNFARDNHPEVMKLKSKIDELKHQLARSQYNAGLDLPTNQSGPRHYRKEIYLPVVNVPQVALELARLTRDVKIQETLYTFLIQQLEQAKIAEVKDTPSLQVLDRAVPAEKKSKPKTIIVTAIAGIMSLFLGFFCVLVLEYIDKQRLKMSRPAKI
ncbi:MAG: hypothetical protein E3K32_02715 [wastewater metagenome]|nr:hypothetical protein [Candidatus Loosdrechtia aerotolerans]